MIAAFLLLASAAPSWAVAVLPSGAEFSLEVRADDAGRALGYMYRDDVGPREGMLFVFPVSGRHGFWMKNCRVSLDIVWLDERLRIVDVAERLPPCPAGGPCPSTEPLHPARYVLEFAAGTVGSQKLRVGDTVALLADPPIR